jgi:hypothetical protein
VVNDDMFTPEERQADIARYGEYRRIPIARFGRFRVDREWHRHISFAEGERETPWYELVFEVDAASEFDLMGAFDEMRKLWGGMTLEEWKAWPVPSRAEILHLIRTWLRDWRASPGDGITWLACYRRRVGPPADDSAATPGPWHIETRFRRPGAPMITMDEATPLMDAALGELERAESGDEASGQVF